MIVGSGSVTTGAKPVAGVTDSTTSSPVSRMTA
jgi:hypothetical protein